MTQIVASILKNQGFKVSHTSRAITVGLNRKISTMEVRTALMNELEGIELSMETRGNAVTITVQEIRELV